VKVLRKQNVTGCGIRRGWRCVEVTRVSIIISNALEQPDGHGRTHAPLPQVSRSQSNTFVGPQRQR